MAAYHFTDKEMLSVAGGEEVSKHLLQPAHQLALESLLQAAVLTLLLSAG